MRCCSNLQKIFYNRKKIWWFAQTSEFIINASSFQIRKFFYNGKNIIWDISDCYVCHSYILVAKQFNVNIL